MTKIFSHFFIYLFLMIPKSIFCDELKNSKEKIQEENRENQQNRIHCFSQEDIEFFFNVFFITLMNLHFNDGYEDSCEESCEESCERDTSDSEEP